jgi:uncharacterized protein with PIN domain
MRFCADHMLGSLARWLRFLGFDCAYPDVLPDKELVILVKKEDRTLLTRDRELAKSKHINALYIESTDLDEQLAQVIKNFKLKITNPFSRCSACNSILTEVGKSQVEGKVPEKVFSRQDEFWWCQKCDKYYWHGTHFQGIKSKIEQLERKTSGT